MVNHKYHTTPYEHQRRALNLSLTEPYYALFMEMGTGKSKVLIDTAVNLFLMGNLDFVLVLAPKGVYGNWVHKELKEHVAPDIPLRVIQWHATPTKAQKNEMRAVATRFEGLTVFVMNIEALSSPKGVTAAMWLGRKFGPRGMIAVDESTTIKNPSAARTKSATEVGRHFDFRRIMSGGPSTKSPLDLWSQADFLSPGLLGATFFSFKATYCKTVRKQLRRPRETSTGKTQRAYTQIVGYRRLDELAERIKPWSFRTLKEECLDLPEKVYTTRSVDLTREQILHYRLLLENNRTVLDTGGIVSAPEAMTRLLRLQQVVCGHLPDEITGRISELPSNRPAAVVEIARETSANVIVWCRFRNDIDQVQRVLSEEFGPETVVTYDGRTSSEDRQAAIENFNNPEHPARFFVGNGQTAGRGITLTSASVVIYYSNSFDLDTRIQSEDRAHRIGQRNPVTYIDLVAENTVDTRIINSLRSKLEISAEVMGEEMREWLTTGP